MRESLCEREGGEKRILKDSPKTERALFKPTYGIAPAAERHGASADAVRFVQKDNWDTQQQACGCQPVDCNPTLTNLNPESVTKRV